MKDVDECFHMSQYFVFYGGGRAARRMWMSEN